MSVFLFGLILFFSVASVVMLLDGKKKPQGEGEAKEASTGSVDFVPDAATLSLAERMKNDPEEFAKATRKTSGSKSKLASTNKEQSSRTLDWGIGLFPLGNDLMSTASIPIISDSEDAIGDDILEQQLEEEKEDMSFRGLAALSAMHDDF